MRIRPHGLLGLLAIILCWSPAAIADDIMWVWYSSDAPAAAQELAVLLDTVHLAGDRITLQHRLHSLVVDPPVQVTPTIHVQLDLMHPPRLGREQTDAIVNAVRSAALHSTSGWVQLDFEPLDSQQAFYVELVRKLRADLPATVSLSVTVRAAWCDQPALLDSIAADEVVPMFFRMGERSTEYRERLISRSDSIASRCRAQAIGIAKQEPLPKVVSARYARRYWFNYKNWQ